MVLTQKFLPNRERTKLPCYQAASLKADDRAPLGCAFFVFDPAGAGE
jgi:hypothetical protein